MDTSARMLRLLSLLQLHRHWPGAELAERLEVSERTLRRDVDRLRQLGYHVESARGIEGGYQMAPGSALPPMVFDHDEAVALAIGLRDVAHGDNAETAEASIRALAKLVAMLPPAVRRQVEVMADVTESPPTGWASVTPPPDVLGTVAQACRDGVRLTFSYRTAEQVETERYVEPYRLVTRGRRWYLFAFDPDRDDWRTFRVDRMADPTPSRNQFTPRPLPADDVGEYVAARIQSLRSIHHVEIIAHTDAETARRALGRWVEVEDLHDDRCRLTMTTDTFDWPLLAVSTLGVDFEVVGPPELRAHLDHVGDLLTRNNADG